MKRILYLCANLCPMNSGDALYSASIVERLARLCAVDVLALGRCPDRTADAQLEALSSKAGSLKLCRRRAPDALRDSLDILRYGTEMPFRSEELEGEVTRRSEAGEKPDLVVIDNLRLAHLIPRIRRGMPGARIALVQHNVEYRNFVEERAAWPWRIRLVRSVRNLGLRRYEVRALRNSDAVFCISEPDRTYARTVLGGRDTAFVIPPHRDFVQVKDPASLDRNSFRLLFLGSMFWYPNVHGIVWFVEHVFRRLVERDSRYSLYIVGNKPSPEVLALAGEKIVVTGRVDDVDSFIQDADLMVVPLFKGGGVKIKILESVMKGLPVIATEQSVTGYPPGLFADGFMVRDADSYIDSILRINADPDLKRRFIDRCRETLSGNADLEPLLSRLF